MLCPVPRHGWTARWRVCATSRDRSCCLVLPCWWQAGAHMLLYPCGSSAVVLSSGRAASATFALHAGVCVRRVRRADFLAIVDLGFCQNSFMPNQSRPDAMPRVSTLKFVQIFLRLMAITVHLFQHVAAFPRLCPFTPRLVRVKLPQVLSTHPVGVAVKVKSDAVATAAMV